MSLIIQKIVYLLLLFLVLPLLVSCVERQVYIVYLGEHNGQKTLDEIEATYHSYLYSVKETKKEAKASLIYSYKHSINGFAALLSADEVSKISEMDEVVSVIRSEAKKYSLHTTRSWEFSGLQEATDEKLIEKGDILIESKYGEGVIVGVIDTGVWPESKSFSDEGMEHIHIPKYWNGSCQAGDDFAPHICNKKLIGAKYFLKGYENYYGDFNSSLDYRSARDKVGHGTHTSSIVAGRKVPNVSALGGFANGTASGGAPHTHLAVYKACWVRPETENATLSVVCFEEDILASIDEAIKDGVHVLSISMGSKNLSYVNDTIAIGALHAVKKNIVVSCSAGNDGPDVESLSNSAPWLMTVAASTMDRSFVAPIQLGNGKKIQGQTVTPHKLKRKMYPLVTATEVLTSFWQTHSLKGRQCERGMLSPEKVKGKIVLFLKGEGSRVECGEEAKRAGAAGFILGNDPSDGEDIPVDAHVLPATAVTSDDAIKIIKYINSTKNPKAYIFPAKTELHTKPAPSVVSFSSRGPNIISPTILKPDITAPGLNILAAWSQASSPTTLKSDDRVTKYNIQSGTSMSCPHVAAIAALIKSVHPHWSSAAIRSAIMTTAEQRNNEGESITDSSKKTRTNPFQVGSGYFKPQKAVDPGLIYNASYKDYQLFLCNSGIQSLNTEFECPYKQQSLYNLNYPSLAIPNLNDTVTVDRKVTNVGDKNSVYHVEVEAPSGFSVKIYPTSLQFDSVGQEKTFSIQVKAAAAAAESETKGSNKKDYAFGSYTWTDGSHVVRSPIAVSSFLISSFIY